MLLVHKQYNIQCDGEGCLNVCDGEARSRNEAYAHAKARGWDVRFRPHLCPKCRDRGRR